jgi:hypothetical protein
MSRNKNRDKIPSEAVAAPSDDDEGYEAVSLADIEIICEADDVFCIDGPKPGGETVPFHALRREAKRLVADIRRHSVAFAAANEQLATGSEMRRMQAIAHIRLGQSWLALSDARESLRHVLAAVAAFHKVVIGHE